LAETLGEKSVNSKLVNYSVVYYTFVNTDQTKYVIYIRRHYA